MRCGPGCWSNPCAGSASARAATAAETIGAIKLVQTFALGESFAASFAADNDRSLTEGIRASRLSESFGRSLDLLNALVSAGVLWFGAELVRAGSLRPATWSFS